MTVRERFNYNDLEGFRVGRVNIGVNSTFVVYRIGGSVFDTGPSNQWKDVKCFIQEKPLEQLILTHHHEDHSGNAGNIEKLTGVRGIAPDITIEKMATGFKIPVTQRYVWGSSGIAKLQPLPSSLSLSNGEPVTAIHCPGHARDMTCYLLNNRGWLFSADLYIANYLKMLRIDEHVPTLLESIQKIIDTDFETIICPHRGIVENGKVRLQEKYDYLIDLAGKVQERHRRGQDVKTITLELLGQEDLISRLSGYNFSKINLIRSSLEVDLNP